VSTFPNLKNLNSEWSEQVSEDILNVTVLRYLWKDWCQDPTDTHKNPLCKMPYYLLRT
jgi:hypothetical protein